MHYHVAVVGAGLAGLACARRLVDLGHACELYEAADRVGGRVASDRVDGFLLDRGFQVLLDSYPEAQRSLDLEALGTRAFQPGALVRRDGRFWRVVDPWRAPLAGLATLRAPFVTLGDGLRMAALRRRALRSPRERDQRPAAELLHELGFSHALREAFFRPFFGGVTLDADLQVPAWYLLALFGWFARGSAVLPANGMQAIPQQLAAALPGPSIHLNEAVTSVAPRAIALASGRRVECDAVVLATDGGSAAQLLGQRSAPNWLGTTTLYYAAQRSPVGEALLVLNGEGRGPVHHLCVQSDAQPSYAPPGSALVCVSVLGVPAAPDTTLDSDVRAQLADWYADQVHGWRLLRVDRIARALPRAYAATQPAPDARGLFVCGDHVATPSIQGALESGRRTAEALHEQLAARAP